MFDVVDYKIPLKTAKNDEHVVVVVVAVAVAVAVVVVVVVVLGVVDALGCRMMFLL